MLAWTERALELGLRFSVDAGRAHRLAAACCSDLGRPGDAHLAAARRYEAAVPPPAANR